MGAAEIDPNLVMRVSYPVDQTAIDRGLRLYSVSRLELYGAIGGLFILFLIAVASSNPGFAELFRPSRQVTFVSVLALGVLFVSGWFLKKAVYLHANRQTKNTILGQIGTREITVTPAELTLQINGQTARWPMRHVRFIDRKSWSRFGKQTILNLGPKLPLTIPDSGEFKNVSPTQFLKLLKRRCGNVCIF